MQSNPIVLVVDDDADCLTSIRCLLEEVSPGIQVRSARSGREALAIMQREQVDCVVADYRMPDLNGLDLLEQTRQNHPHIARHLMTAYPDFEVVVRAINAAGVSGFFRKPLNPETVLRVVQESMLTA